VNDFNKRLNYFDHQFLRAGDFLQEQAYHIDRRRRHTSGFHTPGIVEGLMAAPTPGPAANRVDVSKGWAVDDIGRELVLTDDRQNVDVSGGDGGLWMLYRETLTDPSTDPGITGAMRVDEEPDLVYIIDGQPNPPVGLTAMPSSTGGSLATGIYYYRVTAVTQSGETVASTEAPAGVNGPNGSVVLAWNPVPGPNVTYRIYRGTAPGAQDAYQTSNATSFTDTGAAGTAGHPPQVAPPHAVLIANVAGGVPSSAGPAVGMKGDDTVLSQHIKEADALANYAPASNDPQFTNRGSGIKTGHIKDRAVTEPKLADDAVVTRTIANSAVTNAKLADNAVTNAKLADNAVSTAELADNAVTNPKLADNAVGTAELADNAVTNPKLADNAVNTAELADNAVTNAKLADSAVNTAELANNAVTTGKLADGAATTAKIADDAVTSAKLADDAVQSQHLAEWDGATSGTSTNDGSGVKNAHLADASINYAKFARKVVAQGTVTLQPGQFFHAIVSPGGSLTPLMVRIPEITPVLRFVNTAVVFFSDPGGPQRIVRFANPNVSPVTFTYQIEMMEA
jgi:hypothetical protein